MTTINFNDALNDKRYLWDMQMSPMSVRTANALYNAGLRYAIEVVAKTEVQLSSLPHLGQAQLNQIKEIIEPMGLSFGTEFINAPTTRSEVRNAISQARSAFGDDIDTPIAVEPPVNLARRAAEEILNNAGFTSQDYLEKDPRRAMRLLAEAILACDRSGLDADDAFTRLRTRPDTPVQVLKALQAFKK